MKLMEIISFWTVNKQQILMFVIILDATLMGIMIMNVIKELLIEHQF